MPDPVIVLEVRKRFGPVYVLAGASLHLDPSTTTHLSAANGAGKTTLLRVIAGLTRPDAGTVKNRPLRIGYTPERYVFPSNMSAHIYLSHMARLQGMPAGIARARIGELLDRLRLVPDSAAKLTTLSKGNAQKVLIAQAFLAAPSLLLLDEATTGLDSATTEVFNTMVEERRRQGCAILRTGHSETTPTYPFRTLHLHEGAIEERAEVLAVEALTRIVIRRTSDSSELPLVMSKESAGEEAEGDYVSFVCRNEDVDRYLLEALNRSWSVQAVVPTSKRIA